MRIGLIGIWAVVAGVFWMVSCGGVGTAPLMGDIAGGDDPAEGGIAEVPNPSASMARKSGKSLDQLQRGHEIYMLRCGECHRYQLPQDLDLEDWEDAMPQMIKHAGLASADEQAVLDYVIAVRTERGQ